MPYLSWQYKLTEGQRHAYVAHCQVSWQERGKTRVPETKRKVPNDKPSGVRQHEDPGHQEGWYLTPRLEPNGGLIKERRADVA